MGSVTPPILGPSGAIILSICTTYFASIKLCLFTGHIALMNVTTELKNKAVVNVVVKSNKVIIVYCNKVFCGYKQSLLLYISTYSNSWVALKVSSPLNHSSQAIRNDECQCLNDM